MANHEYVRLETEQEKAYYQPPARLTDDLDDTLARFIATLRAASAPYHPVAGWSVQPEDLAAAAQVFQQAAHDVFGARLSLADEDPTHLDVFLNRHVIAPELRGYFDGAKVVEGLPEADYQAMAWLIEKTAIPEEEALYYFLGAYWGEWLVRHREARWMLFPPLRPMQAFPDMITSNGTVCLQPFSQALKKVADPVGDNLGYKAGVFHQEYIPPYPLTASIADSREATLAMLPEEVRTAQEEVQHGDVQGALELLQAAHEREPDNLLLLVQVQQTAWQAEEWEAAHKAMTALLRKRPHARTFYNLGVLYAQFDLMDEAIESMRQAVLLDPTYGRAKLTMAILLVETGETETAKEILQHLLTEGYDSALQEEAQRLLFELQ